MSKKLEKNEKFTIFQQIRQIITFYFYALLNT
jgi:hypothetical protein